MWVLIDQVARFVEPFRPKMSYSSNNFHTSKDSSESPQVDICRFIWPQTNSNLVVVEIILYDQHSLSCFRVVILTAAIELESQFDFSQQVEEVR